MQQPDDHSDFDPLVLQEAVHHRFEVQIVGDEMISMFVTESTEWSSGESAEPDTSSC